ncbi:MAG: ACT domain-containing protein [Acetivibrionales bacterium]|jgi:aspartokinase
MSEKAVTNITTTYNVALVTVDNLPNNMGLISQIFNTIAEQNINVDMISQAPPYRGTINLSFSLPSQDLVKAISSLNKFKKQVPELLVEVDADNTKLSVYGEGMKNLPGVAAKLFTLLANNGIEVKLVTTSEVDISYLIYDKDVDRAIDAIKTKFDIK